MMKKGIDSSEASTTSPQVRHFLSGIARYKRIIIVLCILLLVVWALLPAARSVKLLMNMSARLVPQITIAGLPVREVHFNGRDGVNLAGWLLVFAPNAPTVILVHGFKGSRLEMLQVGKRS
jgi:hypothetical protein